MKNISKSIRNYKDEIFEDIIDLVAIPSVIGTPSEGKPFGEESAKALDFCMNLGKELGFKTKNVDGYAGHIEYGEGEELVGILAHCDVVAPGSGWTQDPYKARICGDKFFGRGVMDDKGPAVAAIYCLKAMKDLGIKPKRRIRVVIGADEECGMGDLGYYFDHEEMPTLAFSPDGDYPICNREKGIMNIVLSAEHDSKKVKEFKAGEASNIVPMLAEALTVACDDKSFDEAKSKCMAENRNFEIETKDGQSKLISHGVSAHGSTPEIGTNAISGLVKLISELFSTDAGKLITFLNDAIGYEYNGKSIGVELSDDESGPLTLNLGILDINQKEDKATIDIRYPVTMKGEDIFKIIEEKANKNGIKATLKSNSAPLYVEENTPLIQKLKHAYKEVTGQDAKLYASGGGTYARELACGVAFGPYMNSIAYYSIHGANEFFEIENFMKHCEICLQAMYELSCE